jgi:hypothetical protein
MSAANIEERNMIIIAGYELVSVKQRDTWVAAFRDLVTRAREFDGCLHVAITADSVDPERINTHRGVARCRSAATVAEASQRAAPGQTQVHIGAAVRRHRRWPTVLSRPRLSRPAPWHPNDDTTSAGRSDADDHTILTVDGG